MSNEKARQIAELNDRFRTNLFFGPLPVPGHILYTRGVAALPPDTQLRIWAEVAKFSAFNDDNNPHGEHDFGAFDIEGAGTIFWKIDYYADRSCATGSENPADPAQSFRVLTIMLASEY